MTVLFDWRQNGLLPWIRLWKGCHVGGHKSYGWQWMIFGKEGFKQGCIYLSQCTTIFFNKYIAQKISPVESRPSAVWLNSLLYWLPLLSNCLFPRWTWYLLPLHRSIEAELFPLISSHKSSRIWSWAILVIWPTHPSRPTFITLEISGLKL